MHFLIFVHITKNVQVQV